MPSRQVIKKRPSAENKIREIIAEQLGLRIEEIRSEAHYVEDLGADSLDIVELVMAMEEEFELEIPDEDVEKMLTVQDTLDYVSSRLSS